MSFKSFDLHPRILKALEKAGYSEPTPVQLKAIPKVIRGFDIRASAQTGTGKTAAYLLPALHRVLSSPGKPGKGPRVLILAPTRELAMQIAVQAEKYSQFLSRVKTVCVSGGVSYHIQMRKMAKPYEILIATPGRLIDYIHRKKINFSRLEMLVLDEADRMLDMGFLEPVEEIVAATPEERQTLLFSATLQGSVMKLSERLLNKPMDIVVHSEHAKHENITQKLHYVDNLGHKNRLLDHILSDESITSAIIFTSTKRHADKLVEELDDRGHRAAALHGDMSQNQRTRTITKMRDGKVKILVATDVAARGIDIQSISHVINFDLPRNVEDYVHRIGRTGRAGSTGTALSFALGSDKMLVKKIEKFTGQEIDIAVVAGLEPSTKVNAKRMSKRTRPNRFGNRRFTSQNKGRSRPQEKAGRERRRRR